MTDMRVPEHWLTDVRWLRLSPTERADGLAWLLWSVARRSDGVLPEEDLGLCPWRTNPSSAEALLKVGILARLPDGDLYFVDFERTQTSASRIESLASVREHERVKKARQRARRADMSDAEVEHRFPYPTSVPGHGLNVPGRTQEEAEAEAEVTTKVTAPRGAVTLVREHVKNDVTPRRAGDDPPAPVDDDFEDLPPDAFALVHEWHCRQDELPPPTVLQVVHPAGSCSGCGCMLTSDEALSAMCEQCFGLAAEDGDDLDDCPECVERDEFMREYVVRELAKEWH